jgi:hypothetical protein
MRRLWILLATLLAAVALLSGVRAAGQIAIDWSSVDAGGARSSGGAYAVEGTIGQADAGLLSGGRFTLTGGYWAVTLPRARIFVPVIVR